MVPVTEILLREAIAKAARLAISAPNELEVVFPRAYNLLKDACEESAARAKLEALAEEVIQRPVRVVCRFDQSAGSAAKAATPVAAEPKNAASPNAAALNDPYLEQARSVFGAVRVVDATPPHRREPDDVNVQED
jgi:hypothetical protein